MEIFIIWDRYMKSLTHLKRNVKQYSVGTTKGFNVWHVIRWLAGATDLDQANDLREEVEKDVATGDLVWNPIFCDEFKKRVTKICDFSQKCHLMLHNVIMLSVCEDEE